MSDMTTRERICTHCDGTGEVVHPRDIHKHSNDPDVRIVECRHCVGTGYVEVRA